jgi:hypothetical protein
MELPAKVVAAAGDRRSGATEIAIVAAEGLLEVADDPGALAASVRALLDGQPAMAPIWHLARAAEAAEPGTALRGLLASFQRDTDAAVRAARSWLDREIGDGAVATVSHSSLVVRVVEGRPTRLPDPPVARTRQEGGSDGAGPAAAGVLGADAIGPADLLNAEGSAELAGRLPTLVVATPAKLVPADVFDRLAAPGFERVPLERLRAIVLGGEVVEPAEAGRRAARLA